MKIKAIPLLACTLIVGCVTTRDPVITPVQSAGTSIIYHDGIGLLSSSKTKSQVASAAIEKQDRLYIVFSIKNTSQTRFDIEAQNIVATDENGIALNPVPEETLIAEAKRGAALANFGYAMQMAGAGMSGGQQNSYHSGSVSDVYGNRYNYSGSTTSYSQAAQQNELNRLKREQVEFNQGINDSISSATSHMLRRTTLFPGQEHLAGVYFDYPDTLPARVSVQINTGGDLHSFTYQIDAP
jgi:hypothetical protein